MFYPSRALLSLAGAVCLAGCVVPMPGTSTNTAAPTGSPVTSPTVPGPVVDVVLQDELSAIDLLVVVQNTPGTADAQHAFAENLPILLDFLVGSGVDYHIGAISSDISDPAAAGVLIEANGQRWVDMETPNPMGLLEQMSVRGEQASTSAPMAAVHAALETQRDLANAGFYRQDAALAVIVISDGTDGTDPAELTEAAFISWMSALKAGEPASYSCLLEGAGTACGLVTAALGGQVGEVLDAELYELLGRDATGLEQSFSLSHEPVLDTLEVEVHDLGGVVIAFEPATFDAAGNWLDGDWVFDPVNKRVTFLEFIPNPGSEIWMSYEPSTP